MRLTSLLILLAFHSHYALAQNNADEAVEPIYVPAAELSDTSDNEDWSGQFGAGLALFPQYVGADIHDVRPVFEFRASYKDWLFIENTQLSLSLVRSRFLRAGPSVRFDQGRRDYGRLSAPGALGNVDGGWEVGGFAATSLYKLFLSVEAYAGIGGGMKGASAEFELGYTYVPHPDWRITPVFGMVWGSATHQNQFFATETYRPESGIYETYAELLAEWRLSDRWLVKANTRYGGIVGDAGNSPLVSGQVGSGKQIRSFLGLVWLF